MTVALTFGKFNDKFLVSCCEVRMTFKAYCFSQADNRRALGSHQSFSSSLLALRDERFSTVRRFETSWERSETSNSVRPLLDLNSH